MMSTTLSHIAVSRALINAVQDIAARHRSKVPSREVQRKALAHMTDRDVNHDSIHTSRAMIVEVSGSAPKPYMVALFIQGGSPIGIGAEEIIDARCSCPANDVCSHVLVALASAEMSYGLRLAT